MERRKALAEANGEEAGYAPVFCIESAIKTFFWSVMLYDYTEAEGHTFTNIPEEVRYTSLAIATCASSCSTSSLPPCLILAHNAR